ncbi:MAG: alpha/beta hydrolase [Acidobacteria bacterium]|nr:alpha/beta hydrolase [Acidobacteriota bacterium]
MNAFRRYGLLAIVILTVCVEARPQAPTSPPDSSRKREHFRNAEVIYDWVTNAQGQKIRTFVTHPKSAASGKLPAIFFAGWLSCDSVEYPDGETDGFGAIFWRIIEQSGFATVRMDKPGVGESQGDCATTDFQTELYSYRAAFDSLAKYSFIDTNKVFVLGLSNGGGTSPLTAEHHPVRGYIAASSWGRTWYEHMLENERARLSQNKSLSAGEINDAMKKFVGFYEFYLMRGRKPGEIIAEHPDWKSLWYDKPDGQYGRPAAFYQQLEALNLGKVWSDVDAPVLVIHGGADTVMSVNDSRAIAETVNRVHPRRARYVEIAGANHLLEVSGKLSDLAVPTMLGWLKQRAASHPAQ